MSPNPPSSFGKKIHSDPFPKMRYVLDWARGTKYEERRKYMPKEDTNHRKVLTLMYKTSDEDRVLILSREYKRLGREKK